MTTPLPTTTGRIERPADAVDGDQDAQFVDPWDSDESAQQLRVIATGIPCHIGLERGEGKRDGANLPAQNFQLSANTCDLRKDDFWVDEVTLLRYRVDWVFDRHSSAMPMLDRTRARLIRIDGATANPTA